MITTERLTEIRALAEKATDGPWCVESCGEKGDGSNMVGVAFGPDDPDCKRPLSGWVSDDDWADAKGDPIYGAVQQETLVAECAHRNGNANRDASFLAALDPQTVISIIDEVIASREIALRARGFIERMLGSDEVTAGRTSGVMDAEAMEAARQHVSLYGDLEADTVSARLAMKFARALLRTASTEREAWQDISTAPKDGTRILLCKIVGHPEHPTALWWACSGHWSDKWKNWNDGVEPSGLAGPTHWMPLLAPPTSRREGGGT